MLILNFLYFPLWFENDSWSLAYKEADVGFLCFVSLVKLESLEGKYMFLFVGWNLSVGWILFMFSSRGLVFFFYVSISIFHSFWKMIIQ